MKKIAAVFDEEAIAVFIEWAIRLVLVLLVMFVVAVAAGLALQLFEFARGAG